MSHALIIRPEAEADMADGRAWYDEQRDGLGLEFLDAVEKVFERIRENPQFYAPEYKGVRRAGTHRFTYVVYYRVINAGIEVIAVQHGSRSPRRWRSRL